MGGCVAVLFGGVWAHLVLFAGACITLYIHTVLAFLEGRHIWAKWGRLAFLTYGWGIWVYWAMAAAVYCVCRVASAT